MHAALQAMFRCEILFQDYSKLYEVPTLFFSAILFLKQETPLYHTTHVMRI